MIKTELLYGVYNICSKIPDKFIFGFWFKTITKLRAKIIGMMPNHCVGKNVRIYRNVKISKRGNLTISNNTTIKENCELMGNIEIGKNCNILNDTKIDGTGKVIIGDDTHIGRENDIFSHYHEVKNKSILVNKSKEIPQTTVIGKNVLLFSRVGIMSGIIIENNVIIGYGSIVTKSCEKNLIYAGNPAKKIGERI